MYLSFYHLREEPFRLTPDPKFLQLPEPHRDALTRLAHGVIGRKGLMLLSGPIGTGKTTILNGLLSVLARRYPAKLLPTALIVNPRLNQGRAVGGLAVRIRSALRSYLPAIPACGVARTAVQPPSRVAEPAC